MSWSPLTARHAMMPAELRTAWMSERLSYADLRAQLLDAWVGGRRRQPRATGERARFASAADAMAARRQSHASVTRDEWIDMFRAAGFLSDLGRPQPTAPLEVWRGHTAGGAELGISWTTNPAVAHRFVKIRQRQGASAYLLRGLVQPGAVLALSDDWCLSEVVVDVRGEPFWERIEPEDLPVVDARAACTRCRSRDRNGPSCWAARPDHAPLDSLLSLCRRDHAAKAIVKAGAAALADLMVHRALTTLHGWVVDSSGAPLWATRFPREAADQLKKWGAQHIGDDTLVTAEPTRIDWTGDGIDAVTVRAEGRAGVRAYRAEVAHGELGDFYRLETP